MQNDFEVVNHKIENHADISAAIRVRRKPVRLDETRMHQVRFQCIQNRVEALDVAYLQNQVVLRRYSGELTRVRGVFGDWLFDE